MPEGDTIHRTARTLERAIGNKTVRRFSCATSDADLSGRVVESVEARGKHLLIRFDDGRTLHSHMQMEGSWHIYRPGERWQRPAFAARAVIETDDWIAVCFDAPIVELVRAGEIPELVRRLGPDLLADEFDPAEAIARMRELGSLEIGEALLRQQLVAGIGNVYKSECLFLERTNPFTRVESLGDDALRAVLGRARTLMRQNVKRSIRTTRRSLRGPRTWVYGRSGKPCFVCETRIRMRRQGDAGRSTYFCPACQAVEADPKPA